jgi:hypothetical protein
MGLPQEELDLFLELKNGVIRPPVSPLDLEASRAYGKKTGLFPIMHVLVMREALLRAHPWLASSLFTAFRQAKDISIRELEAQRDDSLVAVLKGLQAVGVGAGEVLDRYERLLRERDAIGRDVSAGSRPHDPTSSR